MSENPYDVTEHAADAPPEQRETRAEDRVPLEQKLALGVGAIPFGTGTQIVQVMAWPIFSIALGCHPVLVGLALTIPRLWDAFSDPIMGFISDNFRSRFGRRRPFIALGVLLMAVSFVAMWWLPKSWTSPPPKTQEKTAAASGDAQQAEAPGDDEDNTTPAGETSQADEEAGPVKFTRRDFAMFAWLLVTSLLFYTSYTMFAVPIVSLSYEMTPDYHERTRVMAFWSFFFLIGNLGISWYYAATEHKAWFDDTLDGARVVSVLVAVVLFVGLGLLPSFFVRERLYRAASQQEKVKLIPAIVETVRSRPMLMLLGMTLSLSFVGAMAAAMAVHIVIFHVCGGDRGDGSLLNSWNGFGFTVLGFAWVPLLTLLATRIGKRSAMFLVLWLAALGGIAKWFIYTPNGFMYIGVPEWLSQLWLVPDTITLHCLLLDPLLSGPIWVALGMLVPAMMADLCDVDEYHHGKRREGTFGAVYSWIQKVGFSLTFLFTGLAVWLSGFDPKLEGDQPEDTMFAMRLCFAGFSVLAMLIGILFLCFYNVSERRAYEVRALLEKRRGKAWSNDTDES